MFDWVKKREKRVLHVLKSGILSAIVCP